MPYPNQKGSPTRKRSPAGKPRTRSDSDSIASSFHRLQRFQATSPALRVFTSDANFRSDQVRSQSRATSNKSQASKEPKCCGCSKVAVLPTSKQSFECSWTSMSKARSFTCFPQVLVGNCTPYEPMLLSGLLHVKLPSSRVKTLAGGSQQVQDPSLFI